MFHIIKPEHRATSQGLLDAMHRNRHDVVVDQWGWDIPNIKPGYDKDQFDTESTVYIVVTDEEKGVVASTRLNPTTEPHMLSELFSDFCNLQPYPVSDRVWECSRYVIDRTLYRDALSEFRIRAQLGIGITQFCVDESVNQLSWLTHQKFYNLVQKIWKTEPLGLPRRDTADGWAWIAAVSRIDKSTLQMQRDRLENAEEIVAHFRRERTVRRPLTAA